jgi:hypothetical protein
LFGIVCRRFLFFSLLFPFFTFYYIIILCFVFVFADDMSPASAKLCARLSAQQNIFAAIWGGALACARTLQFGLHAPKLRNAHGTRGLLTPLQLTVPGVYAVDELHVGQLRIWLVVAHRNTMLLETALLRYHSARQ